MVVIAWIALVAALTWLYMFVHIARAEIKEESVTQNYRAITFMFLMIYIFTGLATTIGVILDGQN